MSIVPTDRLSSAYTCCGSDGEGRLSSTYTCCGSDGEGTGDEGLALVQADQNIHCPRKQSNQCLEPQEQVQTIDY